MVKSVAKNDDLQSLGVMPVPYRQDTSYKENTMSEEDILGITIESVNDYCHHLEITDDYGELFTFFEQIVIITSFHQVSLGCTLGLQLFDVVACALPGLVERS